ncbi:hypothetical protein [Okeania sp. SIO2B3]|nr:hypothetical protein [Okeania sp. SIO2B3]
MKKALGKVIVAFFVCLLSFAVVSVLLNLPKLTHTWWHELWS